MRNLFVLGALFVASCASHPAPCADTQAIVDSTMQAHPELVRLSVHARPPGGGDYVAVASSSDEKRGMKSDPEDLRAIESGQTVVLDEPGSIDVTVPIMMKAGRPTAAAGVTLAANAGMSRDATIAAAKKIAEEVAAAMAKNASMPK